MAASDAQECVTKACTKCGEVKALECFSADRRGRMGRCCHCKDCVSSRYQDNRDAILSARKDDRKQNPNKFRERDRAESARRKERREKDPSYKHKVYSRNADRLRSNNKSYIEMRLRVKKWQSENKTRVSSQKARSQKVAIDDLRESYVRRRLISQGFSESNISTHLLILKRSRLYFYRLVKQQKQIIKEVSNAK